MREGSGRWRRRAPSWRGLGDPSSPSPRGPAEHPRGVRPALRCGRSVDLPDELVEILRQHIETFLPDEPASDAWLFTVGDDPTYDNDIDWRWRATRTSAGLPHERLHDLRRFYASGLIAAAGLMREAVNSAQRVHA